MAAQFARLGRSEKMKKPNVWISRIAFNSERSEGLACKLEMYFFSVPVEKSMKTIMGAWLSVICNSFKEYNIKILFSCF